MLAQVLLLVSCGAPTSQCSPPCLGLAPYVQIVLRKHSLAGYGVERLPSKSAPGLYVVRRLLSSYIL